MGPPHIGVFFLPNDNNHTYNSPPSFKPILDSIPPDGDPRFALQYEAGDYGYDDDAWHFRGCRHSLLLLLVCSRRKPSYRQALVWDPVSEDEPCFLYLPPGFDGIASIALQGAVLCAEAGERHVHGGCHSSPLKDVLASSAGAGNDHPTPTALACVYSSETDSWGDLITTPVPFETAVTVGSRTVLVGNSVYWFLFGARVGILEFVLDTESLSVIEMPSRAYADHRGLYLSTLAEDGGLGFIAMSMSGFTAQLWVRTTDDSGGADGWVQGQKIELDRLLSPVLGHVRGGVAFDGDDNVMFVSAGCSVYMVHLPSMQIKKIFENDSSADCSVHSIHPFTSNYPAVADEETVTAEESQGSNISKEAQQ